METVPDRIIDAFGGTTAVARRMQTPLSTVHSWRKIGIPSSRRAHLSLLAEQDGKAIDWETGRLVARDGDAADHAASGTTERAAMSC